MSFANSFHHLGVSGLIMAVPPKLPKAMHYWTMLELARAARPGIGKWKLDSRAPGRIYGVLADVMREGGLPEVSAIKMRTIPEREIETVYVYCGPYNNIPRVFRVATELIAQVHWAQQPLEQELRYKTDLQTIWQKDTQVPKDDRGRPLPWHGRSWLYSYDGVRSVVNRNMLLLHEELENCEATGLTELAWLRRQLPSYLLARSDIRADARIGSERAWLTVMDG